MSLAYAPLRHYQLLRQIGSGGTGITYLGRDTRTLREVAVKIVRIDDAFQKNETFSQRMEKLFTDQMQVTTRLVHPRIVPVLDFGLERDQEEVLYAYLAMPYHSAGSLAEWLSQAHNRASLAPSLIFSLISQAAEVLHYAHERGVLHQDIKPSNFLLSAPPSPSTGLPDLLLTDFEIAPFFAANSSRGLSQSNYVRGTAPYLAPEKWNGRALPASDQYSLAIMAFYLLTGALPFQGALGRVIYQHREVQPPAPSRLNPQLDPVVDKIFRRALAKDPVKRFPSMRAFGQEFARFQALAGGQAGFQPHTGSFVPPGPRPSLTPVQTPVQPTPPLPPRLATLPVTPPAYPAPGTQFTPPRPIHPPAPMGTFPPPTPAPTAPPAFNTHTIKQPGPGSPAASTAQTPPGKMPGPGIQQHSSGTFNPEAEATLIINSSESLVEADPDDTLSPAITPTIGERTSLAKADPDATLIIGPSQPLPHPNTAAETDKQPAVRPATPPQTGVFPVENANYNVPTVNAPVPPTPPGPGAPGVAVPPRNASGPGSPAPPSRPPGFQENPRRGIISQTGKTLLSILLALVILTGGGALLFKSISSAHHVSSPGVSSTALKHQSTAPPIEHVTNPYAGAQGFINPTWAAQVKTGASQVGSILGKQEARTAQYSTAIWLSSIATLKSNTAGSSGLARMLNAAETQAASSKQPIIVTLVLADLPDRQCENPASNSELHIKNGGLRTYESSYIDAIVNTLKQARYRNLRFAAIIEPDVLPTLVTDLNNARCVVASSTYILGIQYALNKLHALPNAYNYLDIAKPDWLGWNDHFHIAVSLITTLVKGTSAGLKSIDGFASNIGNYVPTSEPYLTANQLVSGKPVRSALFYQGNPYIDMLTYDKAMRQAFIAAGFPDSIGMLIDTSRNGWGGPDRPTGPSTSKYLNIFVNASRIDRRLKRNDWCNQPGGLGARPQANPVDGIAAFVWIKTPGLSDGTGTLIPKGSQNPSGQSPNSMCASISSDGQQPTGAMPNAPIAGSWFQAGFDTLVQNAYPPL